MATASQSSAKTASSHARRARMRAEVQRASLARDRSRSSAEEAPEAAAEALSSMEAEMRAVAIIEIVTPVTHLTRFGGVERVTGGVERLERRERAA